MTTFIDFEVMKKTLSFLANCTHKFKYIEKLPIKKQNVNLYFVVFAICICKNCKSTLIARSLFGLESK